MGNSSGKITAFAGDVHRASTNGIEAMNMWPRYPSICTALKVVEQRLTSRQIFHRRAGRSQGTVWMGGAWLQSVMLVVGAFNPNTTVSTAS